MPGYKPTEITLVQGTIGPNAALQFRVDLAFEQGLSDVPLTVTTDQPSAFSVFPTSIMLPPGITSVLVNVVMSSNLPSSWNISVTANNVTEQFAFPSGR